MVVVSEITVIGVGVYEVDLSLHSITVSSCTSCLLLRQVLLLFEVPLLKFTMVSRKAG